MYTSCVNRRILNVLNGVLSHTKFRNISKNARNEIITLSKQLQNKESGDQLTLNRKYIRNAYYQLAKECHPDSAEVNKKDIKWFNALAEAYATLIEIRIPVVSGDNSNPDNSNESNQVQYAWSKLFYNSINNNIDIDINTTNEVLLAATLSRGGLDRGGLWAFVDNFNNYTQNNLSNNYSNVENINYKDKEKRSEVNSTNMNTTPFTRKKNTS